MHSLAYWGLNKLPPKGFSSIEQYLKEFLLHSGPGEAHCIAIHLMESAATEVHLMNT